MHVWCETDKYVIDKLYGKVILQRIPDDEMKDTKISLYGIISEKLEILHTVYKNKH